MGNMQLAREQSEPGKAFNEGNTVLLIFLLHKIAACSTEALEVSLDYLVGNIDRLLEKMW